MKALTELKNLDNAGKLTPKEKHSLILINERYNRLNYLYKKIKTIDDNYYNTEMKLVKDRINTIINAEKKRSKNKT